MEETISLKDIFQTLKRHFKLLILIPIVAMAIAALVSFFLLTPMYQTSTQLLINQTNQNPDQMYSQNDIRTNIELINTYNTIIKSPRILEPVIAESGVDLTVSNLQDIISVESADQSQVLDITVQDRSPEEAVLIANTVAQVFENEIPSIMNVDNVNILSVASVGENPSPVSPNPILNMLIAAVVGLMIAVGLAFLLEYLDTTIKTEKDIEDALGMPVLGAVSNMDSLTNESNK
ncbi:YveK family protein [Alkalicoccobacillus porphyridii]|uniref:Capsular biosynthesis protein n=1 Tax=Alkalicoccobacillus porphyridii TaxID=2597270 RepID=A0A554A4H5_9BACI|nr:Wzz/FepE/Etk N-terminal domain-containing protein [Alkalicoccobacillus porphyridii]TSB48576.1 capsular biosynthesis protein [Alkalicoccobacillus porphyridii]